MKIKFTLLVAIVLINCANAQTPNYKWGFGLGGKNPNEIKDIAIDSDGNIVTVGTFYAPFDMDPNAGNNTINNAGAVDIFIGKYNSKGKLLWAGSIGGKNTDDVVNVEQDSLNNIYITGTFTDSIDLDPSSQVDMKFASNNSKNSLNIYILKLNSIGEYQWGATIGNPTTKINTTVSGFQVDKKGNLYISGTFSTIVDFNPSNTKLNSLTAIGNIDIYVAKYSTNGEYIWAKQLGQKARGQKASKLKLNQKDNTIYLGGNFSDTLDINPDSMLINKIVPINTDMFIAKYDTSFTYQWGESIGGVGTENFYGFDLDSIENIYATGYFIGNSDFNPSIGIDTISTLNSSKDIFIAKYSTAGNYLWSKSIGGDKADDVKDISISKHGEIYLAGYFGSTKIDFNPSTANDDTSFFYASNPPYNDMFILNLSNKGEYKWAQTFSVELPFINYQSCIKTGVNNFYIAGDVLGKRIDLNIGNDTSFYNVPVSNDLDYFLAKYSTCPVNSSVTVSGYTLTSGENNLSATYQWINCDTEKPINGEVFQSLTVKLNGYYAVVVTLNGCTETSDCQNITGIGFEDLNVKSQFNLYPNPTKETITLSVNGNPFKNEKVQLIILDILGNEIKSLDGGMLKDGSFKTINVSELSNGLYFLKINNSVLRFVVKNE